MATRLVDTVREKMVYGVPLRRDQARGIGCRSCMPQFLVETQSDQHISLTTCCACLFGDFWKPLLSSSPYLFVKTTPYVFFFSQT